MVATKLRSESGQLLFGLDARGCTLSTVQMPEVDTVYPADALEFCPHPAAQDIFVCGTYKLDDASEDPAAASSSPQYRRGQCLVFAVQDTDEPTMEVKLNFIILDRHIVIDSHQSFLSYDTSVRLYDSRKAVAPVGTADVGGGVWRVKWHPSPLRADDLLVACMHDGFKVLHFDGADKAPMQLQGTVQNALTIINHSHMALIGPTPNDNESD
ncbi:WD-40 repeat-containing protein [Salix suchowensis]|nr:WD-40 repeat-containing protein [Salix suchowensis]